MEFETQRDQLLHNHSMEKEEMASRADNQIEELQEELGKVQRDRDEALLLAENDRQQVPHFVVPEGVFTPVIVPEGFPHTLLSQRVFPTLYCPRMSFPTCCCPRQF